MRICNTNIRGVDAEIYVYDIGEYGGNETVQVVLAIRDDVLNIEWEGTYEAACSEFLELDLNGVTSLLIIGWYENHMDLIDEVVESMITKKSLN